MAKDWREQICPSCGSELLYCAWTEPDGRDEEGFQCGRMDCMESYAVDEIVDERDAA